MSTSNTKIPRITTVSGLEQPELLLHRSYQNLSNNWQTGIVGTDTQERTILLTADGPERAVSFRVFADQVVCKEQAGNVETVFVATLAIEHPFAWDKMADIPVHLEEAVKTFMLEKLTATKMGVDNRLLAALEIIVIRSVHTLVNSPELISRLCSTIIESTEFVASVAALSLVKSKQEKLATELAKIDDRCRRIVEAGTKRELHSVPIPSEGSEQLPVAMFHDNRNSRACSIQHPQSGYGIA